MSVQAIAWALSVKTKSPSAKIVLVTIANYADEKGYCWPSQALIARQSEQSIPSVQRRIKELAEGGLLERRFRRRQSTMYHLLMPLDKKHQDDVSTNSIMFDDRPNHLIHQNQVKMHQLCGTEPSLRTIKERKIEGGHSGKKGKPRHGITTKDRSRLWLDHGTIEWNEYAKDYRAAHSGIDPPLQWNGAGTWFSLLGEISH